MTPSGKKKHCPKTSHILNFKLSYVYSFRATRLFRVNVIRRGKFALFSWSILKNAQFSIYSYKISNWNCSWKLMRIDMCTRLIPLWNLKKHSKSNVVNYFSASNLPPPSLMNKRLHCRCNFKFCYISDSQRYPFICYSCSEHREILSLLFQFLS